MHSEKQNTDTPSGKSGTGCAAENDLSIAVIMITLNEAHNMPACLENLADFASEIFVVDSFSTDDTAEIAREFGVHVVQRAFTGFGDQWNYAVTRLPVASRWTMKLDPDERLTEELKQSIRNATMDEEASGFILSRRLWFMQTPLPVRQKVLRIWRTGSCRFGDVLVNEHPIVPGAQRVLAGDLEHHDSPNLIHWLEKQNRYTTAEAISALEGRKAACEARMFGNAVERRMWLKSKYRHIPGRHMIMFLYCYIWMGAWRAGKAGYAWSNLRVFVYRMREYKLAEMRQATKSGQCREKA